MRLKLIRRLTLEFLGEDWGGCYIDFNALTFRESKELMSLGSSSDNKDIQVVMDASDKVLGLLLSKFVGGKIVTDEGVVDMKKSELEDFPVEVLVSAVSLLTGKLEKKD